MSLILTNTLGRMCINFLALESGEYSPTSVCPRPFSTRSVSLVISPPRNHWRTTEGGTGKTVNKQNIL